MCRAPFDLPKYRCRLVIERVQEANTFATEYITSNINPIVSGFGFDLRQLIQGIFTDIRFDIDEEEDIRYIMQELGLPSPPDNF
jgi:hypothetical protein